MRVPLVRSVFKNVKFVAIRNYTSGEYIASQLPDVEISNDNVVEYVMKDFSKWSNKTAVVNKHCFVTGKQYTFEELRETSYNLSKSLRKIVGLKTGDIVALLLHNSPQFVTCTFGTLLSGLRLTTINPLYTADEIKRQLEDSNAKTIVTVKEAVNNVQQALQSMRLKMPIILITSTQNESVPQGFIKFEELVNLKTDVDLEELNRNDFLFLPYSSGTTGLPKGVMLTNNNLTVNIAQYQAFEFMEETTEKFQELIPSVLPMFHIYGFTIGIATALQRGVQLVTLPKFNPKDFINLVREHRATLLKLVPPLALFISSHPEVKREYLQSVKTVVCAAAPVGISDEEKLRKKIQKPINMVQAYGMTETSPMAMGVPLHKQGKFPGTMGEPAPNTLMKVVSIDDPRNKHLGPNQTGELLIKGPQVMLGYYGKPEETSKAITVDGWYRSGDLVRYDEDGMFYVADRIKEMIKVKGFQVAPAELEEVIKGFEGVADVAVVGVPHPESGEVPRAYVVPKEGANVDARTLSEHVAKKVAPYKKLAGGVALVGEIPKSPSGKILRREIKVRFEEEGI